MVATGVAKRITVHVVKSYLLYPVERFPESWVFIICVLVILKKPAVKTDGA